MKSAEWEAISKRIDANKSLRKFRQFLLQHPFDIIWTDDLESVKKNLLLSSLKATGVVYDEYVVCYKKYWGTIEDACKKTTRARALWNAALREYQMRFAPPFEVCIENRDAVFVGAASEARLRFHYKNSIDEERLQDILSMGERRVLMMLQLVFELKFRSELANGTGRRQIVVLDDIVDSFDYRHKYALVEYLKDLSDNKDLWFIVLTHNFDFYRLVATRLGVDREMNAHFAIRTDTGVKLHRGEYQRNILSFWANSNTPSVQILLAMVPFARNLCEYRFGEKSDQYLVLTSCLHAMTQKGKIEDMMCGDVLNIYETLFESYSKPGSRWTTGFEGKFVDLLFKTADQIVKEHDSCDVHLEKKIVLAMATRIHVEQWLCAVLKISKPYEKDQTGKLIGEFKRKFPQARQDEMSLLQEVSVVTPEYIHLNAFMYEALVDTSIDSLRDLYLRCKKRFRFNAICSGNCSDL